MISNIETRQVYRDLHFRSVLLAVVCVHLMLNLQQLHASVPFPSVPAGWKLVKEVQVPADRLQAFSQKLGAPVKNLFNSTFEYSGSHLQINTVETTDEDSALKIRNALRVSKSNPRWVVQNGNRVFEFVVRDQTQALLAAQARYAFPVQPAIATYEVAFTAWPVASETETGAANKRNELFNLFLQFHADPNSLEAKSKIQKAVTNFQSAESLLLTGDLQKGVEATWTISPAGTLKSQLHGQLLQATSPGRNSPTGISLVDITGTIRIDSLVKRPSGTVDELSGCVVASSTFPGNDPQIRQLADEITRGAKTEREKLQLLLGWFSNPANIHYDGLTGTRYGAKQVCEQRFGRCWDYSDLMISLCRSLNLPARQVYGWVYESEGHVWCDVSIDGVWVMVDPTTGTTCGSDYIPLSLSETGDMTWIYASPVTIALSKPDVEPQNTKP